MRRPEEWELKRWRQMSEEAWGKHETDSDAEENARFALVQMDVMERTLRAVNDNALGWHAGEDGKARALNVIAVWTSEALAGRLHPDVELITSG